MKNERARAVVRGAVQGVGFRPFVYRLAKEFGLTGWVMNTAQGAFIEAEGPRAQLNQFLLCLEKKKPPRTIVQSLEFSFLEAAGYAGFEIRESTGGGGKSALILPDIAPCAECLADIFDPSNRRHHYPFTNCTNCGPRYSIIEALPYDRPNTSMKAFAMCPECRSEYDNPANRRFHAQPNACPQCGPQLQLWDAAGHATARENEALLRAAAAIRDGQILALKGVGGFQLIVDSRNGDAIRRLRERKAREAKPFAVLYARPASVREDCDVNDFEARLLASPEAPIVLLRRNGFERISPFVAPGNPNLGAMLPSSPLHHLLARELDFPVVATSGNLSDEPICIDEKEALRRLNGIADLFLIHDRPIVRAVDDSVARVMFDTETILRRARGYAPLPIHVKRELPQILAVGPHLKNTVAISLGKEIFVSQHIGDLESGPAWEAFRRTTADLQRLYDFAPESIACDEHPDYLSTKHARACGLPVHAVQHHYAHVLACMAEHDLDGPVLGVCWDGTGFGGDGTIWGGEFLLVQPLPGEKPFERVAHLRTFRLPGGEAAVREPRRSAVGLLWEIFDENLFTRPDLQRARASFTANELSVIRKMLANQLNTPITSSAGRLFDGVASLLGLRERNQFEGQAAMDLEFASDDPTEAVYPFEIPGGTPAIIDWRPAVTRILDDVAAGEPAGRIAGVFHNTLAQMIVSMARRMDVKRVVLTGGCFQNKRLLEGAVNGLRGAGFLPFWHQRIPPNDGGISVGQILGAARAIAAERKER
jgi:hydrogenase maturation protein HypF